MSNFVTSCRFLATSSGTVPFVVASAIAGHVTPENANVANGKTYHYWAQTPDGSQTEEGHGVYTIATHTLTRVTIDKNSDGTLVPINFIVAPEVDVFPSTMPLESPSYTRTVLTSGSGTYTTPVGCRAINIRLVGGGGGGGGGGSSGGAGGAGSTTIFGTSLITATGGNGGGAAGGAGAVGGIGTGGDVNLVGSSGQSSFGAGGSSTVFQGGMGGSGPLGGSGYGGWPSAAGLPAPANTGGGGGGGGSGVGGFGGGGGGAGGYCEKLITLPSSTYTYTVGANGAGGAIGGSTQPAAGGNGGSGIIIIDECY